MARARRTSKHAIIIPQAGAILTIRGNIPANKAEAPSVRTIRSRKGKLDDMWEPEDDITIACRLVLRTSKGEVISAAVVPLTAPLINATQAPSRPRWAKAFFQDS
jgi:hypothetical protein